MPERYHELLVMVFTGEPCRAGAHRPEAPASRGGRARRARGATGRTKCAVAEHAGEHGRGSQRVRSRRAADRLELAVRQPAQAAGRSVQRLARATSCCTRRSGAISARSTIRRGRRASAPSVSIDDLPSVDERTTGERARPADPPPGDARWRRRLALFGHHRAQGRRRQRWSRRGSRPNSPTAPKAIFSPI